MRLPQESTRSFLCSWEAGTTRFSGSSIQWRSRRNASDWRKIAISLIDQRWAPQNTCLGVLKCKRLSSTVERPVYEQRFVYHRHSREIAVQVLVKGEVNKWFSAFPSPSPEYVQCDGREPFFGYPEANCIDLEYPPKLERLPFFARFLATVGYDEKYFEGAMLWFTAWHIWNSADEAAGYHVVEAMNSAG